jgi:hypothetical protein
MALFLGRNPAIIAPAEIDFKRLRDDTNDPRVEVESDEMVTLTPGLKRHVTFRCRHPPIADEITLVITARFASV